MVVICDWAQRTSIRVAVTEMPFAVWRESNFLYCGKYDKGVSTKSKLCP